MKHVNSPGDFEAMLRAERAVVFIFYSWSKRAILSQFAIEEWAQESAARLDALGCVLYQISPDGKPYAWKWINAARDPEGEGEQANGMVIWSKRGSAVGGIQDAAAAGTKRLNHLTNYFFSERRENASLEMDSHAFDVELLKILCCPETHQKLQLAAPPLLEKLNQQITSGRLRNRSGQAIQDRLDAGLVRADGRWIYPLRQNIPVLLVDEAIPVAG